MSSGALLTLSPSLFVSCLKSDSPQPLTDLPWGLSLFITFLWAFPPTARKEAIGGRGGVLENFVETQAPCQQLNHPLPSYRPHIKAIFQGIAAKVGTGEPCCDWVRCGPPWSHLAPRALTWPGAEQGSPWSQRFALWHKLLNVYVASTDNAENASVVHVLVS